MLGWVVVGLGFWQQGAGNIPLCVFSKGHHRYLKKEDNLKNEDNFKNEDNLKNDENLKTENDLNMQMA